MPRPRSLVVACLLLSSACAAPSGDDAGEVPTPAVEDPPDEPVPDDVDAGFPEDAGFPFDAGFAADAGFAPDAGFAADAGFADDGGFPADAGFPSDGGFPDDGGFPADAGFPFDAGFPSDAGFWCGDGLCLDDEWTDTCAADCGPEAEWIGGRLEERLRAPDDAIDAAVRARMDAAALVGLAIGVVEDGVVVYAKGYGFADRGAQVPVLAERTRFRWASISKTVTGVVVAQLATDGALDLNAPVQSVLPDYAAPTQVYRAGALAEVPEDRRTITIGMLASHTAGIAHYANGAGSPAPPAWEIADPSTNTGFVWALAHLYDEPLVELPGERWSYSTFGFNLLGRVVEVAGGAPYDALVQARVAGPAGMTTLVPDVEHAPVADRARGYDAHGAEVGSTDVSWKLPGGGYLSVAGDLARYCAALVHDTVLLDDEKALAWTSARDAAGLPVGYGLGFVVGVRDGRRVVEHAGSQEKTSAMLRLWPDEGRCIVVVSNSEHADTNGIAQAIDAASR